MLRSGAEAERQWALIHANLLGFMTHAGLVAGLEGWFPIEREGCVRGRRRNGYLRVQQGRGRTLSSREEVNALFQPFHAPGKRHRSIAAI